MLQSSGRSCPPCYSTGDRNSFGYRTARERWPVMITGAIDDACRSVSDCEDAEKRDEGKKIVEELAKLKYEVQHDRQLTPICDDGHTDVPIYNKELERLGKVTWQKGPWLFTECYLFRRMNTFFSQTKHWKTYDVFARQKVKTFRSSRPAVLELAALYRHVVPKLRDAEGAPNDEEADKVLFMEMCEICLWGNATDLSLLTSLTYDDIQKLQGTAARKAAKKNIVANDLPQVFDLLLKARKEGQEERRVDIVVDNAGFELFVDLVLAGYLLAAGLATGVVLHPKSIPWFVSDVLPSDFACLLKALADPRAFYETQTEDDLLQNKTPQPLSPSEVDDLSFLFEEWGRLHAGGQLAIRPNRFWTHPGSFWQLPAEAPSLMEDLRQSIVVVFKGDLNYRKLTCDAQWDPTTPFPDALGPLGAGSGVKVLALRTCKADVVVGLKPGQDESLRGADGGSGARKWAWSGKWAVVSFSPGI